MRVGIIGAGNMGSAFARRLSAAGHDVLITSKEVEEARQVAQSLGGSTRAVPPQQLAEGVEIVIAATPYEHQVDALRGSGRLDGKTVIEISNPLKPDMSGLIVGHTTSAAEEVAKAVPGARVVKAFNTVFAQILGAPPVSADGARVQVFYASDDTNAKDAVRALIDSMSFEPVDAGPLSNARYLEPLGMLNIYFGYVAKLGTEIAPAMRKVPATQTRQATQAAAKDTSRRPEARP